MAATTITLDGRTVGPGYKPLVIAEVGQAHDGSLGNAHAFIDGAADAGSEAIKFQTHIAAAESTLDEQFRVAFSKQDKTRYDYWRRMEFTPEQWSGLADHARERGLMFLSTPFSVDAVALLNGLSVPAWKIGSGEYKSRELIDAMLAAGQPILLSTGMSKYDEIAEAIEYIRNQGGQVGLFQCTSMYPTPFAKVGLNVIGQLQESHGVPVGLSDHSGQIWPAVGAMVQGADMIEIHIALHRRMFGPDTPASLTLEELTQLCAGRDAIWEMARNPVDKDDMAEELKTMRQLFTKSMAVKTHHKAGTVLAAEDLTVKKPGSGIPAQEAETFVGRTLARDVNPERLLQREDFI